MSNSNPRPDDLRPGNPRLRRSEPRTEQDDVEKPVSETFAPPEGGDINIGELQKMSMKELLAIAEKEK